MLKLGTQNISGLYVGEQKIKKAFVGEQLVFEDNPTYTVYFYAVDEEDSSKVLNSSSFTVNPGESVSVNPWDINGYNFAGWYDESGNLVSSGSSFSVTPTGDATYYLKYYEYYTLLVSASGFVSSELVVTINGKDYTITRNADAQGNGAELHLRKNSVITVKIKTIPSGYKFDKWGLVYANVTSTADPYTFTLTRDLEILHGYLSKASRLPAGYTEVEYVHFPGGTATYFSQAIPSHTQAIAPSIELDVKLGTKNPGTNKILISTSSPIGRIRYFSLTTEGSSSSFTGLRCPTSSANNTMKVLSVSVNQKVHVEIDNLNKVFKVGSSSVSIGGWTFGTSTTTGYAGDLGNSLASYVPEMWVYEYKYYTSTQYATKKTLAKHWVPCIRTSDNSIGFYDLVNKTFTAKSGAGTVEAGPAV